jgi:hypothetical protein
MNSPAGRTTEGNDREASLANFYAAERRAGVDPVTANERMAEYARRLDALAQGRAS